MTYYTYTENPIGNFIEKNYGNNFEYSKNDERDEYSVSMAAEYPHRVWVGGEGVAGMSGWRYAIVKKTVAYIVTDEDELGNPVTEKWQIKNHDYYQEQ